MLPYWFYLNRFVSMCRRDLQCWRLLTRLEFQPLVKAGFLGGAELDAGIDAVDGFGQRSGGGVHWVSAKEIYYFVAALRSAERTGSGDDTDPGVGGELGVNFVPVLLDVGPGLGAGGALTEEDREDSPTVLIANLTGGGVVECAGHKGGIEEAGKRLQGI